MGANCSDKLTRLTLAVTRSDFTNKIYGYEITCIDAPAYSVLRSGVNTLL